MVPRFIVPQSPRMPRGWFDSDAAYEAHLVAHRAEKRKLADEARYEAAVSFTCLTVFGGAALVIGLVHFGFFKIVAFIAFAAVFVAVLRLIHALFYRELIKRGQRK